MDKDVAQDLKEIKQLLKHLNSKRRRFLLGVISGTGTAIGATVVGGLILALMVRFLTQVEQLPWLEDIVGRILDIVEMRR